MAWIVLWVIMTLFTVVLLAFLYSLFFVKGQEVAKPLLGLIDTVLGWAVKHIVAYLFNAPSKTSKPKPKANPKPPQIETGEREQGKSGTLSMNG